MSKRLTRREMKRDEVMTALERAYVYVDEHRREFFVLVAVVVVAVLTVTGAMAYRDRRIRAASEQLGKAIQAFGAPVEGSEEAKGAEESQKLYSSEAEKLRVAEEGFEKVTSRYRGTGPAQVAQFYIALCKMKSGDAEGAASAFQAITLDKTAVVAGVARLALATLAREKGEPGKAVDVLKDKRYAGPPDAVLFLRGLALEDEGKTTAAAEAFKELRKSYPDSGFAYEARARLDDLREAKKAQKKG